MNVKKKTQHVPRFNLPIVQIGGAPVVLTEAEVVAYARRIDEAIVSLENDTYGKLVYVDPQELRDRAKIIDETVKTAFPPGGPDDPGLVKKKKEAIDSLVKTADALDARGKTRSKAQLEAEKAFGTDYELFVARWKTFFNAKVAESPSSTLATIFTIIVSPVAGAGKIVYGEVSKRSAWTQIEGFESEFRRYYERFKALGYAPSAAAPPSNEDIAKEHPGGGLGSLVPTIPWGTFALVGGAVVLGYLWLSKGSGGGGSTVVVAPAALPAGGGGK